MKKITIVEFRGHTKECMAIKGSWSEESILKLFRSSGWELPSENITSVWNVTKSLMEDEFPRDVQVKLHLSESDMVGGKKLPDSQPTIDYIVRICKAIPIN